METKLIPQSKTYFHYICLNSVGTALSVGRGGNEISFRKIPRNILGKHRLFRLINTQNGVLRAPYPLPIPALLLAKI
jgi:hypothetical protein